MTTRAEQETTMRWDQQERVAYLETTYAPEVRYWRKQGLEVEVADEGPDGTPRAWTARAPKDAIRIRRVKDGWVVKRQDHGMGRRFEPKNHDQLVESEDQANVDQG